MKLSGDLGAESEGGAKRIERVIVHRSEIEIVWRPPETSSGDSVRRHSRKIPFEPHLPLKKGVAHSPAGASMDPRSREALLQAIARAQRWMDQIMSGKAQSLDEIAAQENLVERYVRRLSVLAFLSPKIVRAIMDGAAPSATTET